MPTATQTADPQAIAAEAIKGLTTLATLPEITTRIIATIEDPRSSAGKLHAIVAHDPALATRILRMVNSAVLWPAGKNRQRRTRHRPAGIDRGEEYRRRLQPGADVPRWKIVRGVRCARSVDALHRRRRHRRELARLMQSQLADEAFLAGLIHDIGILVELQFWPEQVREVCKTVWSSGGDFCQSERAAMRVDHQVLGKVLTEHWNFPRVCQDVAAYHHDPTTAADDTRTTVTLVHVADVLCCQFNQGFNLTALNQKLNEPAMAASGIDAAMLEAVGANLKKSVADAAGGSLIELHIGFARAAPFVESRSSCYSRRHGSQAAGG